MKKLLTVLVAVLCVFTCVCADEPDTKTTSVSHEVEQSYEWSVPVGTEAAPIAMGTEAAELGDVQVTRCIIADGYQLEISIASDDWNVEYAEDKVSYEISLASDPWAKLVNDDVVLTVEDGKAVLGSAAEDPASPFDLATAESQKLYSLVTGSPVKAGKYIDTLTFTANVVESN